MSSWSLIIRILVVSVLTATSLGSDWTVNLDYSLNDGTNWFPLGIITLKRSFDGNYTGTYRSTTSENLGIRLSEAQALAYKVKGVSSTQPGKEFISSTSPCLILQSRLFHVFWASVDGERQILQSLTVFPDPVAANGQLDSQHCSANPDVRGEPKATVHVQNKAVLPSPDTQSFVQKMERERKAKVAGAEADNRSFIQKYWMYIVPVVLFVLVSNMAAPQEEGGRQ